VGLPFHLDEDAATRSVLTGLAASGWHTAALTMRMLVNGGAPIIGANVEITWPNSISDIKDATLQCHPVW
jgi:hypothetical protein